MGCGKCHKFMASLCVNILFTLAVTCKQWDWKKHEINKDIHGTQYQMC